MSDKFCLKWNDFQTTVSSSFKTFRQEEDFFDVTLVSDDEVQMSAHKLILSACSSFFKSILKKNPHSSPLLYLSGVDSTNLGYILDYIYQGEVQLFQDHLNPFMDVAQKLKIEGLLSKPEEEESLTEFDNYSYDTGSNESFNDPFKAVKSFDVQNPEPLIKEKKRNVRQTEPIKTLAVAAGNMDVKETVKEMYYKENDKFVCKPCGKYFKDSKHVLQHVETHIDGLSYDCPLCNKSFRSTNAFYAHKSRSHKNIIGK